MRRQTLHLIAASCVVLVSVFAYQNCSDGFGVKALTTSTHLSSTLQNGLDESVADLSQPNGPPDITMADRCTSATVRGFANQSSHKLTKFELQMTIQDLLGVSNLNSFATLTAAFNSYPLEYTTANAVGEDFEKIHTQDQVMAWIDVADEVANLMSDPNQPYLSSYMSGTCSTSSPSSSCYSEFITRLGRKLYRRPLANADVQNILTMVLPGDAATSFQSMIARMLRSPYFVFHIEAGDGTTDSTGRVHLSAFEIANRISYATTGSMPDATLSMAAEQNQLSTPAQVKAQVDRLLASDASKAKMHNFFSDWFRLKQMKAPDDSWGNFAMIPDGTGNLYNSHDLGVWYRDPLTSSAGSLFEQELYDYVDDVIWSRKGSFADLMTLPLSYPREPRMAALYGTTYASPLVAASTPNNPGLLTRAALLSYSGLNPSAIMRGVNLKRRVLCDILPAPDFSIVASRVIALGTLDPYSLSNHDIVTQTTASSSCISCHSSINPVGFLFEDYNPLGQKKSVQQVPLAVSLFNVPPFSSTAPSTPPGVAMAEWTHFALPSAQTVSIEAGLPTSYNNSDDFIKAISQSKKARSCMSVRFFRHLTRREETPNDACALNDVMTLLQQNQPVLSAFSKAIANDDIFWRKPQ